MDDRRIALWLDGWLRARGLTCPWSYTGPGLTRADLVAWRAGFLEGQATRRRAAA